MVTQHRALEERLDCLLGQGQQKNWLALSAESFDTIRGAFGSRQGFVEEGDTQICRLGDFAVADERGDAPVTAVIWSEYHQLFVELPGQVFGERIGATGSAGDNGGNRGQIKMGCEPGQDRFLVRHTETSGTNDGDFLHKIFPILCEEIHKTL